jgi:hypothetical protein
LRADLTIKGINYDVGTEFRPDQISRPLWDLSDVTRDMRVIHEDLHCTNVNVYGTDIARLEEAGAIALEEGLSLSVQPRSIDADRAEMLRFVAEGAQSAERLRSLGDVTLNTGCEITLFTSGFLPGRTFLSRIRSLAVGWPFLPLINSRLNRHLQDVVDTARDHFGGSVTYGAGTWESVDWDRFDVVGVNLYRDRWNEKTYLRDLRKLFEHGKPVVITEFGCCTFEGAERKGGGGWTIVDFDREPPVVKPGYRRSEPAQAEHVGELLDLFASEGVHGAYVFDFMAPSFTHHAEPASDLDMASYGVVKVLPHQPGDSSLRWERKEAFEAVARRYRPR